MKRAFSFGRAQVPGVVWAGTALVAATYGLVRMAYGLFLPDVQADLGLGTSAAGFVAAGASVMYCAAALVGFVVATAHPRPLVLAAALSAGPGAVAMAWAPDARLFGAAAVVASAGAGLASPALVSIVGRTVTGAEEPRAQGVVNAGTGPGLVVAGVLALVLLPDWRLAWTLVGVGTVVTGAVVLLLDRAPADVARPTAARFPPRSWFVDHRRVLAASALLGAGSAATWNYGRAHLVEAGAAQTTSVLAWVALGVGGTAVIATARVMGRLAPRTTWGVTTSALALATVALGVGGHTALVAMVAAALFGWAYTAGTGGLIVWTSRIDPTRAAAGTSLLFVVLVLGQALGAAAVGVLVGLVGHPAAFVVAAAVALLAVPAAWSAPGGGVSGSGSPATAAPPCVDAPDRATAAPRRPAGQR